MTTGDDMNDWKFENQTSGNAVRVNAGLGNTAWSRVLSDGRTAWLTDPETGQAPTDPECVRLHVYPADGVRDPVLVGLMPLSVAFLRVEGLVVDEPWIAGPHLCTGQSENNRWFWFSGEMPTDLTAREEAILDRITDLFAEGCSWQEGVRPEVHEGTGSVDMAGWPDGVAFGPWFAALMQREGVQVYD